MQKARFYDRMIVVRTFYHAFCKSMNEGSKGGSHCSGDRLFYHKITLTIK